MPEIVKKMQMEVRTATVWLSKAWKRDEGHLTLPQVITKYLNAEALKKLKQVLKEKEEKKSVTEDAKIRQESGINTKQVEQKSAIKLNTNIPTYEDTATIPPFRKEFKYQDRLEILATRIAWVLPAWLTKLTLAWSRATKNCLDPHSSCQSGPQRSYLEGKPDLGFSRLHKILRLH